LISFLDVFLKSKEYSMNEQLLPKIESLVTRSFLIENPSAIMSAIRCGNLVQYPNCLWVAWMDVILFPAIK
jgi:hypothetical protein